MIEAYGLSNYRVLKKNAQLAINYLERHRNPYGVWRYQPRDGDNDTSVTGWCVLAYKSARDFDLEVNQTALQLSESSGQDQDGAQVVEKIRRLDARRPVLPVIRPGAAELAAHEARAVDDAGVVLEAAPG